MFSCERRLLQALATIPRDAVQRSDGLRCERRVLYMSDFHFRWGLRLLRWRGLVKREVRPWHTLWASCRRIPFYSLTREGWITAKGKP